MDLSIFRPRRPHARRSPFLPGSDTLEPRTLTAAALGAAAHVAHVTHLAHHGGSLRSSSVPVPAPTHGIRAVTNIVYTDKGGPQQLDLYLPTGTPPPGGWPTVLSLAGGGWRWVPRSALGQTVSALAGYGYAVVSADYLFAGNQPGSRAWPTDFADTQDAVRWIRKNAGRFGLDPSRIAVWGESAGAHLATLLGTYPDTPATLDPPPASPPGFADGVSAKVQAVIDFYGPTDMTALYNEDARDRPYILTFLGGTPDQVPGAYKAASPLDYVAPGDPPMLIFQGTGDQASPADIAERFIASLQAAGVPEHAEILPGVPHGFRLRLDHGNVNLLPEILQFLDEVLKSDNSQNIWQLTLPRAQG